MKKVNKISWRAKNFCQWYGYDVNKVRNCMKLPEFELLKCETTQEIKAAGVTKDTPYMINNPLHYEISKE